MGRADLDCRTLVAFIADYLEDGLPAPDLFRFEAHLASCPDCVDYLESYGQVVRWERELLAEARALPGNAPAELVEAILAVRPA